LTSDGYRALFEHLEILYNGRRWHPVLGYVSRIAFERRHEEKRAA